MARLTRIGTSALDELITRLKSSNFDADPEIRDTRKLINKYQVFIEVLESAQLSIEDKNKIIKDLLAINKIRDLKSVETLFEKKLAKSTNDRITGSKKNSDLLAFLQYKAASFDAVSLLDTNRLFDRVPHDRTLPVTSDQQTNIKTFLFKTDLMGPGNKLVPRWPDQKSRQDFLDLITEAQVIAKKYNPLQLSKLSDDEFKVFQRGIWAYSDLVVNLNNNLVTNKTPHPDVTQLKKELEALRGIMNMRKIVGNKAVDKQYMQQASLKSNATNKDFAKALAKVADKQQKENKAAESKKLVNGFLGEMAIAFRKAANEHEILKGSQKVEPKPQTEIPRTQRQVEEPYSETSSSRSSIERSDSSLSSRSNSTELVRASLSSAQATVGPKSADKNSMTQQPPQVPLIKKPSVPTPPKINIAPPLRIKPYAPAAKKLEIHLAVEKKPLRSNVHEATKSKEVERTDMKLPLFSRPPSPLPKAESAEPKEQKKELPKPDSSVAAVARNDNQFPLFSRPPPRKVSPDKASQEKETKDMSPTKRRP